MVCAEIWTDHVSTGLTERSQAKEAMHCMVPLFYEMSLVGKSISTESSIVVAKVWE